VGCCGGDGCPVSCCGCGVGVLVGCGGGGCGLGCGASFVGGGVGEPVLEGCRGRLGCGLGGGLGGGLGCGLGGGLVVVVGS
jgi:hypothetical protein